MASNDISETVVEFNNQLLTFLEELQKIHNDNDVVTNITIIKQGIEFNAFLLIDQFVLLVYPFKDKIDMQDEQFFLQMDINSHIGGGKDEFMQIMKFTGVWKSLNSETKQSIFDYMKVLVYYAEEYLKKKLFNMK